MQGVCDRLVTEPNPCLVGTRRASRLMCEVEGRPGCSMEEEPTAGTFATEQTGTALETGAVPAWHSSTRQFFRSCVWRF